MSSGSTSSTDVPFKVVRPGGARVDDSCQVEGDYSAQLKEIADAGLVFTAELLDHNQVNLCLEHPRYGDFMCRLAGNEDGLRSPPNVTIAMLKDWNRVEFQKWLDIYS